MKEEVKKKKKRGRPRKKVTKATSTVRLSKEIISKLKVLKGKRTMDSFLDELFSNELILGVDQKLYPGEEIKDVRGYSIQNAVREQRTPELPVYYLPVGKDTELGEL